ncbi:hypothetical protein HDU92_009143, partial [Lobulomyces angularis]
GQGYRSGRFLLKEIFEDQYVLDDLNMYSKKLQTKISNIKAYISEREGVKDKLEANLNWYTHCLASMRDEKKETIQQSEALIQQSNAAAQICNEKVEQIEASQKIILKYEKKLFKLQKKIKKLNTAIGENKKLKKNLKIKLCKQKKNLIEVNNESVSASIVEETIIAEPSTEPSPQSYPQPSPSTVVEIITAEPSTEPTPEPSPQPFPEAVAEIATAEP